MDLVRQNGTPEKQEEFNLWRRCLKHTLKQFIEYSIDLLFVYFRSLKFIIILLRNF